MKHTCIKYMSLDYLVVNLDSVYGITHVSGGPGTRTEVIDCEP